MTDDHRAQTESARPSRPRPQFGELASPEEQRAAIAVPVDLAASEPVPVADASPKRSTEPTLAQQTQAQPAVTGEKRGTDGAAKPPADRFVSWALLGVGLFNVLTTSTALVDLPAAITQFFAADGLDPYGPVGTARVLGIGALVVNAGLWILTLVIVQRRVNAGKSSWWIPLVTGVVATLIVLVCVGGAMMIDPSVFGYIQQMSGATP